MLKMPIIPNGNENIYNLLVKKELDLRKKNRGTFHRIGKKKKDQDVWYHSSKEGFVTFQRSIGEVVTVLIKQKILIKNGI